MGSAWNQLEQMLTCAICLDKYKNPRLLPCQHSFCGDACMEGLVDYARRQIKCPECRAEHRIPYQGVQSLPVNVTLIRFLELHARITGDEPEPVPTFMEKCAVCGEKIEGVARCWHCDKKVCPECREAHLEVLRRELGRVNGQGKRCLSRLVEFRDSLDRQADKLETNESAVRQEIEEACRRLTEDLEARKQRLLAEVDRYVEGERDTISKLKTGLNEELEVLEANWRLAEDKFTGSPRLAWTDQELNELKGLYTRAMEFVRLFEPELGDCARKLRFNLLPEFESARRRVCELGELKLAETSASLMAAALQSCGASGLLAQQLCQQASAAASQSAGAAGSGYWLSQSNSNSNLALPAAGGASLEIPNALMRSQSDHRLASQFQQKLKQQQQQQQQLLDKSVSRGYSGASSKTATSQADYELVDSLRSRYAPPGRSSAAAATSDLLTRDWPRPSDPLDSHESPFTPSIHFKSAFMRRKEQSKRYGGLGDSVVAGADDDDLTSELSFSLSTPAGERNVRFYEPGKQQAAAAAAAAVKLFDLPEADRAPLSGLARLDNSAHLAARLHQMEARSKVEKREVEAEEARERDLVNSARLAISRASQRAGSQLQASATATESADDIERQKRANKEAAEANLAAELPAEPTAAAAAPAQEEPPMAELSPDEDASAYEPPTSSSDQPAPPEEPASAPVVAASEPGASPGTTSRRSLYGQAVTEKSRQQLSSAAQEAASQYSAAAAANRRRLAGSGRTSEPDQEPPVASAAAAAEPSTSTMRPRRNLKSLGRSGSSRQSSVDGAAAGDNSPGTTQRRRKLVARAETAQLASTAGAAEQPARSSNKKQTAPVDAGSLASKESQEAVGDSDAEETEQQDELSRASEDSDPRYASTAAAAGASDPTSGGKRLSRELLPNAVNKLLDRSAQIRRDSQEQRSRGDSPQRTPVPARPTQSSYYGGSSSSAGAYKSRFGNQRSQSIRDPTEDAAAADQVNNSSSNSVYTTASSSAHSSVAGRKSSTELETPSGYSRQLSGSSGERTLVGGSSYLRRDSSGDAGGSGYRSRFLARSRTSAALSSTDSARSQEGAQTGEQAAADASSTRSYLSSRDKFLQSAASMSATTGTPSSSPYSSSSAAASRSLASAAAGPAQPAGSAEAAHSEYLRNKFASRRGSSGSSSGLSRSRSSMRASSLLGASRDTSPQDRNQESLDADQDQDSDEELSGWSSAYSSKGRMLAKLGQRGADPGNFTWPRGVAVGGAGGEIVVADSSNHRVQVFDSTTRRFLLEFGSYGSAQGQFDCLAGVAINRLHRHYVVSDRYNHRIQLFDLEGRFVRSFGDQGRDSGKFNLPWGVACDTNGSIYVCDKENHRIQVFDHQGAYLSKFGLPGSGAGQLQHPHYIAVGCRKILVTDTNNHRVQVFDMNGRMIKSFGGEGSGRGQFKFPRGIAMDEAGFIVVGDSGNNRLQVFNPEGNFVRSIGTWGCADGEFKGIEGVAVDANHNILVCDRENHRIQIF